jgi:hypothetical protein
VSARGTPADVAAVLSALPGPGPKRVRFTQDWRSNHPQLAELVAWLPTAISAADVTDLALPPADWASVGDQAVASLVLALAGLQRLELHESYTWEVSLLDHLCRALTAESPLTELALNGRGSIDAGLQDLAALIAHNHSRLRTLSLYSCSILCDMCDCPSSAPACWTVMLAWAAQGKCTSTASFSDKDDPCVWPPHLRPLFPH